MSGWNIVCHYRFLRIKDNPALAAATTGKVLHNPTEEGKWAPGSASIWWLHHSLQEQTDNIRNLAAYQGIK